MGLVLVMYSWFYIFNAIYQARLLYKNRFLTSDCSPRLFLWGFFDSLSRSQEPVMIHLSDILHTVPKRIFMTTTIIRMCVFFFSLNIFRVFFPIDTTNKPFHQYEMLTRKPFNIFLVPISFRFCKSDRTHGYSACYNS